MKNKLSPIELHVAGAIVKHSSPFENLESLENQEPLSPEFIEKWVNPFYQINLMDISDDVFDDFRKINQDFNADVLGKLLGAFNWRPRIVGSILAAIKNYDSFENIIGIHLLKSELCYAGRGYCLALASFKTDKSKEYLKKYLDYYLTKKELFFEQGEALSALNWIDAKTGLNDMEVYLDRWNDFIDNKTNWNLQKSIKAFNQRMNNIELIRQILSGN